MTAQAADTRFTARVRHAEHVMGTVVSFDVPVFARANGSLDAAIAWLHWVDGVFSPYRADSDVSRLARAELDLGACAPEVAEVLEASARVSDLSHGYFTAYPGGRFDPSGYVKGWATERAASLLTYTGSANHLVNAGGDVQCTGVRRPGEPWRIGIADPFQRGGLALVVVARDCAVATSGLAERGWHILDPHTGRAACGLASLTVIGPSLTLADAYATAAFAMGPALARDWTESVDGYEAFAITSDGHTWQTPGFGSYIAPDLPLSAGHGQCVMRSMTEQQRVELGAVQRTLFIPLAARARETTRRRPVLRDPKAVEMVESIDFDIAAYARGWGGGFITVHRTLIFDWWVRQFLAEHPAGTVVELGIGLNTRFERTDNGTVHWIDLDLPDTIALRRRFFADTDRRQMVAASLLDEDWMPPVDQSPGPYFFVSDGVLTYLAEDAVTSTLERIARRFPGALLAFDTYSRSAMDMQHKMAAKRDIARWQWACDDPRSLARLGLRVLESAAITRPPRGLRDRLPARYKYLLPLFDPVFGKSPALTLFQAG